MQEPSDPLLAPLHREIAEAARVLCEKGWAEGNGGNLSVRLGERRFLVTGSGTRMREVALRPEENLGLLELDEAGRESSWRAGRPGLRPTSELATHLAVHGLLSRERPELRAVLHTHATELIALTHLEEGAEEQRLNRLLRSLHPEIPILVPEGVALVPFRVPGTAEQGAETAARLGSRRVALWEKHGVVAVGKGVSEALDLVEALCQAARIFFLCLAAGGRPAGLGAEQMAALQAVWGPGAAAGGGWR